MRFSELKVGDKIIFQTSEQFDKGTLAEVTEVHSDHVIAKEINDFDYKMTLWVDEDTEENIRKA